MLLGILNGKVSRNAHCCSEHVHGNTKRSRVVECAPMHEVRCRAGTQLSSKSQARMHKPQPGTPHCSGARR